MPKAKTQKPKKASKSTSGLHHSSIMADNNPIIDERTEYTVYPTGGRERLRTSHFLEPSVSSIDGPAAAPTFDSSISAVEHKTPPFDVKFNGWRIPQADNWNTWVDQMRSLHEETWKKAGIFDAVMSSKCRIRRQDDLILGLVEKWCPATNSFVFPWGEATISLEDMIVIAGFSVLGESVLKPPQDDEMKTTVNRLMSARYEITKTKAKNADQSKWIARFMGKGSRVEHEAFLACWLSRFVFPISANTIHRSVVSVAVRLARGTKIALAPAVLASIYKNLSKLKAALVAARKSENDNAFQVAVSAPLALFQVWIWERFPTLRPKPNSVGEREPRMARWHDLKKSRVEDMQLRLDSAGEKFQFRPYTRTIYRDNEYRVAIGSGLDEDLEGLVRCLRMSELVGVEEDCIEQYLPHRVGPQFGLDQDIPGHVPRLNVNRHIAWNDYVRPIVDMKLYVPARLYRPRVTARYLKWWKRLNLGWSGQSDKDGKNSSERSNIEAGKGINGMKLEEDSFVAPPPGFPPNWNKLEVGSSEKVPDGMNEDFVSQQFALAQKQSPLSSTADNDGKADFCGRNGSKRKLHESSLSDVSDYHNCVSLPGFEPKNSRPKASDSGIGVQKSVAEQSSCGSDGNKNEKAQEDDQGKDHLSSLPMNDGNTIQEETLLVENVESEVSKETSEGLIDGLDMEIGASSSRVPSTMFEAAGIGFEERIKNIEKIIDWLKVGRFVRR